MVVLVRGIGNQGRGSEVRLGCACRRVRPWLVIMLAGLLLLLLPAVLLRGHKKCPPALYADAARLVKTLARPRSSSSRQHSPPRRPASSVWAR